MAVANPSRMRRTETITYRGQVVYGAYNPLPIMNIKNFSFYTVGSSAGRVDQISAAVYGTPEYWWAIIVFNGVLDPINWPKRGDIIKIPSFSDLLAVI